MKRILYVTRARLSFTRAHAINMLKTADAIVQTNRYAAAVFSSAAEPHTAGTIRNKKGIAHRMRIDVSPRSRSALLYMWNRRASFDVLYFRDPFLWYGAFFARTILHKRVVFEVHGSHEWPLGKPFWRASVFFAHGIVFITNGLREYYQPVKPHIVTHASGVDEKLFNANRSKEELRAQFGLPLHAPLIMYAGSFLWYSWEVLVRMMAFVPPPALLVFVGAKPEEKKRIEEYARKEGIGSRIRVYMRVAPSDYPSYICAADVLVNPLCVAYPGSISSKIFEYLAAGRPIVAARGKAMEEVLTNEKNALLADVTPEAFGKAVNRILNDRQLAAALSHSARESARRFTWEARANDICSLIDKL